jgi:hypothetical protein
VHRVFQGAVPDVAYTDPGHGKEMIVQLKFTTRARRGTIAMWQQAHVTVPL